MNASAPLARTVLTEHGHALRWELRRNCCLTPLQLGAVFASTAAVSLGIGAVFWWLGFAAVAAFALAEVVGLALALLAYARHACDADTLTLDDQGLFIEQRCGQTTRRIALHRAWARLDGRRPRGAPVRVCEGLQAVQVGAHVRPALRDQFVGELERALRCGPQALRTAPGQQRAGT
jgi:uncharacterized membrane protein